MSNYPKGNQSRGNQSRGNQAKGNQAKGNQAVSRRRRSGRKGKPKPVDLWRPVPPLSDPAPIVPATDPTALVRSLGEPPLPGPGAMAELAIAAVVDRAAGLAAALALSGDLLAPTDDTADEDDGR
jgi:hypothetical protein